MPFLPQPSPFTRAWNWHQETQKCVSDDWVLYLNHIKSKDYIGYAICKTCNQALKHNKLTSGTTHLNNHLKQCNIMQKYFLK